MSTHRGISPFHDVSPQRDIPLSWCQPTEGYPPFMCQPQRGVRCMGGGHLESIHFAPTCCTLVPSPLFTLSASPGWLPDDKMRIGRNADDKMRIEKCGWEINCGWQNTDGLNAQRAFTWDSYQNKLKNTGVALRYLLYSSCFVVRSSDSEDSWFFQNLRWTCQHPSLSN